MASDLALVLELCFETSVTIIDDSSRNDYENCCSW